MGVATKHVPLSQIEFERNKLEDAKHSEMNEAIENATTPEEKKQLEVELEAFDTKARRRSLGNIRFIGELFKLDMLSETIMHECIVRLLQSSSDEESLECFARLITTTGKELDQQKAKVGVAYIHLRWVWLKAKVGVAYIHLRWVWHKAKVGVAYIHLRWAWHTYT